jgi:hypothetical protein
MGLHQCSGSGTFWNGSVPLTNGSGFECGSATKSSVTFKVQTNFSKEIFVLKFYFATIFSVHSTEKGRIRSRIHIRIHTCDQRFRMRNREAQKHPSPKHWITYVYINSVTFMSGRDVSVQVLDWNSDTLSPFQIGQNRRVKSDRNFRTRRVEITINVPAVYMARYVMILRRTTSLRGALEGGGP